MTQNSTPKSNGALLKSPLFQRISGKTETPEKSEIRAANGTWLIHENRPNFAKMFRNLQTDIAALDLSTAEPWQILSYNSDGYYAHHYDFLNPDTNKQLVEARGNRIATVLVILQIAKKGGTTVFPKINLNIRPKAGDVVVWLNTLPSGESDSQTLHAACPIKEGTKIGATLWVHAKGQEFSMPCAESKKYYDRRLFFE
ncbi:CRE-PHY-4 protein [Caenorhabditis remanei]|uniref:CRE-PHY-4 protein n=1 Tax=Caenorhabditis remanei TaxID=31234 RepID=E3N6H0_CAERE|nr:CRE-PHY-4 protein [Caenorhabditis remanei]